MKTHIRVALKHAVRDRSWVIGALVLIALAFLLAVILALQIRPSELQLPVRYTSFGSTNFYRDKWYYLLSFVFFGIFVMLMNLAISLKLYEHKGLPTYKITISTMAPKVYHSYSFVMLT